MMAVYNNEATEYINRVNRAIEYIENHSYGLEEENYDKINDILDILKGSDTNENI